MLLVVPKLFYILGIAVVAFLGGLIPFLFKKCTHSARIMSIANACAGGIFLAVGFCHMLPEGVESLEGFQGEGKPLGNFPLGFFLLGIGGLLILFVEKVMLGKEHHDLGHGHAHPDQDLEQGHYHPPINAPEGTDPGSMEAPLLTAPPPPPRSVSLITSIVLVVALGVHSFIEGLALGIIETATEALLLFIAIIAHKWAETAALSIAFITAGLKVKINIIIIIVFSLITPVGIAIGMSIGAAIEGDSALIIRGCLQVLAAGTFTYVSYIELISEAFEDRRDKWLKLIVLLVGFGSMAAFALLE